MAAWNYLHAAAAAPPCDGAPPRDAAAAPQVTDLVSSHDGSPPVLAGAVVEGPNSFAAVGTVPNMRPRSVNAPGNVPYSVFGGHKAVFRDNAQSYSTVEPAVDLTALCPLAFAWQQARGRAGF